MSNIPGAIVGVILAMMAPGASFAEADGPDFYRVTGVASDDVLNIRARPSASGDKVGSIPHDGDGIANLGCEGGLSYAEWSAASEEERAASSRHRWCQISFEGVEGWVAGRFLAEGSAPKGVASPSFDCSDASGPGEEAICGDVRLARLDNELARLYHLAVNGPNMSSDRLPELKTGQRDWIKDRDNCTNSEAGLNACIAASYASRIDDIRTGYYDSRQDDGNGISSGPIAYVCGGLGAALSLVSVAADPGLLSLRWRDNWITPVAVPSGSGAKYQAVTGDGTYEFWAKGKEAQFVRPDGTTLTCNQDDMG